MSARGGRLKLISVWHSKTTHMICFDGSAIFHIVCLKDFSPQKEDMFNFSTSPVKLSAIVIKCRGSRTDDDDRNLSLALSLLQVHEIHGVIIIEEIVENIKLIRILKQEGSTEPQIGCLRIT